MLHLRYYPPCSKTQKSLEKNTKNGEHVEDMRFHVHEMEDPTCPSHDQRPRTRGSTIQVQSWDSWVGTLPETNS